MTIRFELTMLAIAAILLVNSVLSVVGVYYVGHVWLSEIQDRVRQDANSAEAAYQNHLRRIESFLEASTLNESLAEVVLGYEPGASAGNGAAQRVMDRLALASGMDFLTLLDQRGRVVYRSEHREAAGDGLERLSLLRRAMAEEQAISGTIRMTAEQIEAENPRLANRVRVPLRATAAARPVSARARNEGLVMAGIVPIRDLDECVVGYLFGGNLLNHRDDIVDAIRGEVFLGACHEGEPIGAVTLFLDDVRVATNVLGEDGQRAIGTRMSEPVYAQVIERGQEWAAPAFVVSRWYITAYRPLRDPDGQVLGALYVGVLRSPFLHRRNTITQVLLAAVLLGTGCILALLLGATRWVLGPISQVIDMCHRVVAGDLDARVGIRPWGELGVLCEAVDDMASAIQEREEQLAHATRRQIGRSEKLASIGRLAAGIAHEINNPMTGVLTFSHLLRDRQPEGSPDREDLDVIIQQTERVAEIVRGLLDFARERAAVKGPLDVNEAVRRIVRLVENQKELRPIHVELELAEHLPEITGDANQLQQVLLNLILNAAQAMPDGGSLTIGTSPADGQVVLRIADTGTGIAPNHVDKIFDPFFTTKPPGQGTGLGLSVSYGIVEQHGGSIEVSSELGQGTEFTIRLPVRQKAKP